ncbi:hypothetical protein DXG03_007254 [Asterophora parasitica]|uniref:Uncharacterized protein n=1 Tax=Asterophora parasitica TaxID=117018 RepID=A0A9P7K705_9AGAR|nr:hypothetical protein DXG03_007254 [Asterophora parasitica]
MDFTGTFSFMPEIQDEIFECAARMYRRRHAPTLALVSKSAQARVERIIYETIKLSSMRDLDLSTSFYERFQYALHGRPGEFFAERVLNPCVTDDVPESEVVKILAKCTGVRNLAIWNQTVYLVNHRRSFYRAPPAFTPALFLPFASSLSSLSASRRILQLIAQSIRVYISRRHSTIGDLHSPSKAASSPGLTA